MATTVIAAAAARAEREIIDHLRQSGATTPAAAVPVPDLRPLGQRRLRRLLDAQVVRPAGGGFYLDETLYASYRSDRRAAIIAVLIAVIALVAGVVLGYRSY